MFKTLLSFFMGSAMAAPSNEKVVALPEMGTFDFGVYSGYVQLTKSTKVLHYILAESQTNPTTDPLVVWFNGGPGCSSVLGWATENGPYVMPAQGTTFVKNEYSWNKEANVLYLEQPAGVGYSYADCQTAPGDCQFNDTTTGVDNLDFIQGWFLKYPEYQGRDLYIAGESYAGIYGPTFAYHIDLYNKLNTTAEADKINLKGFAIGDGVTNWAYDTMPATLNMTHGHGIIGDELWGKMSDARCDFTGIQFNRNPSDECMGYLNDFYDLFNDLDIYNIYKGVDNTQAGFCSAKENDMFIEAMRFGYVADKRRPYVPGRFTGDYTPWYNKEKKAQQHANGERIQGCVGGDPLSMYLNNAEVKALLHIRPESDVWRDCANLDYTILPQGSQWIYEHFKGSIRMMHYSGDQDGCVPTFGTLQWMNGLNWQEKMPWTQVTVAGDQSKGEAQKQVAGYFWSTDGLDFSLVHGAGHMVPQDQPYRAYQMVMNWILNKPVVNAESDIVQ